MSESLLPLEIVMQRAGIKRTKIYSLIAAGEFPAPVKIGSASRWPASKIDAWVKGQIAEHSPDRITSFPMQG